MWSDTQDIFSGFDSCFWQHETPAFSMCGLRRGRTVEELPERAQVLASVVVILGLDQTHTYLQNCLPLTYLHQTKEVLSSTSRTLWFEVGKGDLREKPAMDPLACGPTAASRRTLESFQSSHNQQAFLLSSFPNKWTQQLCRWALKTVTQAVGSFLLKP